MTSKKIPVSYEYFKKYTNHEECVSVMLQLKANGNKEAYEALLKRKDCKEKALRSYYEAFYLKPRIREKYHIRIKPVPKKIKDKLLVIPVQDTENISETETPGENNKVIDIIQEVINGIDNNNGKSNNELEASHSNSAKKEELKSRILMSAKYVCDGDDQEVEDDNEPLSSPDICSSSKQINAKINSAVQENKVPIASSSKPLNLSEVNSKQSNATISTNEKKESENSKASSSKPTIDKQTGLMANNNYKPANPNTESIDESVHLKPDINYKALVPYIHCCPLTLKEFRKYSNISQLVAEFCENKHKSDFQQRIIVQHSYLLFYLAPEYRTITPINKIQLAANAPAHIKNIFFNIPSNLYLMNDANKTQEQNLPESTNNATQAKILPIINSSVTGPVIDQNKSEVPQHTATNDVNEKATMPEAVNNCNEQVKNVAPQNSIPLHTDHTTGPIVKLPVSLDEFKKYTNHEEVVDKLFKIKAQDNKELYYKYKNSQEAFDSTLRNYFQAFYLSPIIRETFPIRFKPLPNSIKNRLLQIPEGVVKSTSMSSFRIEDLVSLEFNLPVVGNKEEEISAAQQHNALNSPEINSKQYNANVSSIENNESENSKASSSNSSNDKQTGLMANNQFNSNTESKDESVHLKPDINYKALVPYIHCCPLTLKEFRKYSNISQLVAEFCENKHKSDFQQRIIVQHSYLLFYLAAEYRTITPINKIQLAANAPARIKNIFFNIPSNLYLMNDANKTQEQNLPESTNNATQAKILPIINSSVTGPVIDQNKSEVPQHTATNDVNEKATMPEAVNNCNEQVNNVAPQNSIPLLTDHIAESTNNATQAKILPITNSSVIEPVTDQNKNEAPQNTTTIDVNQKATMPEAVNNCNEQVNNLAPQNSIPLLTDHTAGLNVKLPVSLDEFKKYTNHEEIVDKLFKIKAQDNKESYYKYKNSQEAFDSTLRNYFQAFYLSPIIRETFPIRFKPLPNSIKNRLLQIPEGVVKSTSMSSFRIEDLVSLEFNLKVVSNKGEEISAAQQHNAKSNINHFSKSPTKDNQSSGSDNKTKSPTTTTTTGATKRATTEDMKSPSPKRKKSKQSQDYAEKKEKTKKVYKELLPYAHCCPVTFSEFRKYTNVTELFSGYCQNLYKSLHKLPYMLQRAYVLYYLAPENRNYKPLNKLKTLNECPSNLRSKIFEIPRNLYLKGENTDNVQTQENIETPTNLNKKRESTDNVQTQMNIETQIEKGATTNKNLTQDLVAETTGAKPSSSKSFVEILENRLLPPLTLPITGNSNAESNCPNTNCVFHHITQLDFVQLTDILQILPEPHDSSVIQNIFKKFIYKIVKEQSCDEKYVVKTALWCKLLKHNEMCEKCENDMQSFLLNQVTSSDIIESERESMTTVIERSDVNNKSMQTSTGTPTIAEEPRNAPAPNKSSITNQAEISTKNSQSQLETTDQQENSVVLCENLKDERIFQLFRQQLLAKLKHTFDNDLDFTSETYEIFLQCNEIPLKQLLNDFCEHNEDVVQRILNERELYEALQRYYYYNFLKNVEDNNNTTDETVKEMSVETQKDKTNTQIKNSNEINSNKPNAGKTISPKSTFIVKENVNNINKSQVKAANNNNSNNIASEKAKRIFFRSVLKTDTLSYILHTSFSLKHLILHAVLSMTFEEFLQLTSIYNGKQLYADKHIAECMYRYVFRSPMVWPTNLFITLKNLCDFLHAKNIRFDDYSKMLIHISPKLLHWSVLLTCTNILESVQIDYEKRTGKLLDTTDTPSLKQECIGYYNRCWKHEKWLREVPKVYEEFYKDYLNSDNQGDVIMRDESELQEICEEPNEVANNIALTNKDMGDVTMMEESELQDNCEEPNEVANNVTSVNKDMGNTSIVQQDVSQPVAASNLNTSAGVDKGDVIMRDESELQAICEQPNDVANNIASDNKVTGNTSIVQQDVSQPAAASNLNTSAEVDKDPDFVSEINVETPAEVNTSPNRSLKEFNCVMLPNTQQQIEMLPAEVVVSNDPLNKSCNGDLSCSSECYEVECLGELIVANIKTEPINSKLLQNLQFFEDEDSIIQCTPYSEEIVELDDSRSHVGENLPPSQIEFEDMVIELIISDDNAMNMAQCLASSSGTACTQEQQQNKPMAVTSITQLPDVSLRSSGEDEIYEKILEDQQQKQKSNEDESIQLIAELENLCEASLSSLQSFITYPEAQRFPSTFEDIQSYGGNLSAEQVTTSVQQDLISTVASENVNVVPTEKSTASLVSKEVQPATYYTVTTIPPSNTSKAALPLRRDIVKTYASKNKVKVKPLKNSDFVPQIQHNTRPLQTIPVYSASSRRDNIELQPSTMISKAVNIVEQSSVRSLTPPEINLVANEPSIQSTNICISQELQTNCSVFNNTSLLRIVDHNYHQQSSINVAPITLTQTQSEEAAGNPETNAATSNTNQQPTGRVTPRGSIPANNNPQPVQTSKKSPLKITTTKSKVTNPQASTRIVTRRTSLCKDTNDKVNNIPLTSHTNNLLATIAPIIHRHQPYNMLRKLSLYRQLIQFHYFKEITPQHISKYLLPSLEYGKSYTEATVACEHFKTRISNRSISVVFSFWPQNLQHDFLLVLSDLKEFHYVTFERDSMQKQEDLRARILFWLLHTAPTFGLCQFIYETNSTEFGHCESVNNGNNPSYKRKPFKCVSNALSSNILDKLKDMKRNLKKRDRNEMH